MPAQALSGRFDVAIIGAGVVGCAIARRLALAGARVAVIERAADILDGASKGNSAILHTGFDAPPGSLELQCIRAGREEYLAMHERLGLPLDICGALVIAWTEEEEAALPELMQRAMSNGVSAIEPLDRAALRRAEPELAPAARAGFRVPGEGLIDPWSAPHAYLLQAMANGTEVLRGAELKAAHRDGDWFLDTTRGQVRAALVINAAGNFGDLVDEILIGHRDFTIRPRKGQFIVYDKPAASLARHILLPVPTATTKGIVVCRTAFGNLLVGPTAEDQEDRLHAGLDAGRLAGLIERGQQILPALARHEVTAIYAGLRPATERKEYCITAHEGRSCITVGGIRSTGLTAALGIARHVERLAGLDLSPPADPAWPRIRNISEFGPRDWQQAGHGGVVCHCELVTRREILEALSGPLPARSLAGLKRRSRVTMGRCQGFYCSAELSRLTRNAFERPLAETMECNLPPEVDVIIVGAGPAGLAAAAELAPHCRVLLLERESAAGGIPRHCGHYPFGMTEFRRIMKGPDYARALVARAEAAGVRPALNVNVVALHAGPAVTVTCDGGLARIGARRVLLATGVRESSRAQRLIGGTKPGGVLSTGALQAMVYLQGARPFRRPVILGTELVSFSAIMTCAHAGIRPVAMIEPGPSPVARWPAALYPRLKGIALHLATELLAIEGCDQVEAVTVAGPSGTRRIETDGVIVSGRFRPEAALLADGPVRRDPRSGGPCIDSTGRCSDPHFYAAGNLLHPVETAGWCWREGRAIARAMLRDLGGHAPAERPPVTLAGDALSWVVPQHAGIGDALDRLQLRVTRPVKGRLRICVDGEEVSSSHFRSRPERRILLPIPGREGEIVIALEEGNGANSE